jgi:hypothetical protein
MADETALTPQESEKRRKAQAEIDRINAEALRLAEEKRAAKEAADKAQVEAFEKARAERIEAEMKSAARRTWGGTEAEFEAQWPTMRMELLREKAKKDSDIARDQFGKMVQGFF